MTHWHCSRCRLRVTVYRHAPDIPCPSCGSRLSRGAGRGTRADPHRSSELDPPTGAELLRRALDTRRPPR